MIAPRRRSRSSRSAARHRIAITSEATVMSKPDSRGKPLATPPSEQTTCLSARSFMSMTRRQVTRRGIDAEPVAPVDVVVDQRRQQVVRRGDGMEIAGEMEVDVLHRDHLRAPAAGRPALHPEARTERRLANADDRLAADAVQPVAEADRRGRLALAGRRRIDRRHQDQLAVGPAAEPARERRRHLGLVRSERAAVRLPECRAARRFPGSASA